MLTSYQLLPWLTDTRITSLHSYQWLSSSSQEITKLFDWLIGITAFWAEIKKLYIYIHVSYYITKNVIEKKTKLTRTKVIISHIFAMFADMYIISNTEENLAHKLKVLITYHLHHKNMKHLLITLCIKIHMLRPSLSSKLICELRRIVPCSDIEFLIVSLSCWLWWCHPFIRD